MSFAISSKSGLKKISPPVKWIQENGFDLSPYKNLLFPRRDEFPLWAMKRQYTVFNDSREVGRIISDAYIAGLWSPMICLENRHCALCVAEGWFNDRDTFRRYPLTHLFLWGGNHDEERRFLNRAYPQIMAKTKEIKIFYVKGHPAPFLKIEQ